MDGFPPLNPALVMSRLAWPSRVEGPIDLVLDTDTYNEIDDQFAVVYALLSPERFNVRAVHAAPFHNVRSNGPADGMERSYEEILRLFDVLGQPIDGRVFRGAKDYLTTTGQAVPGDGCDHLIAMAREQPADRPLYVAAIGAITNVASALLVAPDIREKIVVLWLGGHPLYWPTAREFNLRQDPAASRLIFDCGVPLVHFPCRLVAELVRTNLSELETHLKGHSAIGTYLTDFFTDYNPGLARVGASKEIWDLAPLTWLMDQTWVETTIEPSPVLTEGLTWSRDARRHPIRVAQHIQRDHIFSDLFEKCLASNA